MGRFILQKSSEKENRWVCTDKKYHIVCTFEGGDFNGTQKFTPLEDLDLEKLGAAGVARVINEMAGWLRENHYDLLFPTEKEEVEYDDVVQNVLDAFAAAMERVMLENDIPFKELEDATGIPEKELIAIRNGEFEPDFADMAVIAHVLGIKINYTTP